MDEQTHHCDVQRIQKKILIGRCNRNQQKEHALTGGGLQCYELAMKKSAEVIVLIDTSCVKKKIKTQMVSRKEEGLNVEWFSILNGLKIIS